MMTDLYAILGIPPDAEVAEIRAAYRAAAKTAHPDTGADASRWALVRLARDVLGDPDRRRAYDETGETAEPQRDQRMSKAVDLLSRAMEKVLDDAAKAEDDVTRIDVMARLRRALDGWQTEGHQAIQQLATMVATQERMRGRFVAKGDSNIMEALTVNRIEGLERRREQIAGNLEILRFAVNLIDGVTYRADAAVLINAPRYQYTLRAAGSRM
jgi:curved DNA-binding protein CbpA